MNIISKYILHKLFYGLVLRIASANARRIFCCNLESIKFVNSIYKVKKSKLTFLPIGGRVDSDDDYKKKRFSFRSKFSLDEKNILIVQSGKQDKSKNLIESLSAIHNNNNELIRFFICGLIDKSIEESVNYFLRKDPRISYLGWLNIDQLTNLLSAADVYLQPATQSVTMQHSLCCRCPVILDYLPSHEYYVSKNGWLIGKDGTLEQIIDNLSESDLVYMGNLSYEFACNNLDYAKIAQKYLE